MAFWLSDWLWAKRRHAILHAASDELDVFLEGLLGCSEEELGMLAASVADAGRRLTTQGIDAFRPTLAVAAQPKITMVVSGVVQKLQKEDNGAAAAGWIVWTHTFRAEDKPALRRRVREMWGLVAKGFDEAHFQAVVIENTTGQRFLVSPEFLAVPNGCEVIP